MATSPLQFIRALEGGKTPPASCLLTGEEPQLIEEARACISQHFAADDRYLIDADKFSDAERAIGQSKGLFGGGAQLYQFVATGKPANDALKHISEMRAQLTAPDCIVVIISEWNYRYKKAAWFKALGENLPPIICDHPTPAGAAEWIHHWAQKSGVEVPDGAARLLAAQTEGNLFAAKQAIAKLALLNSDQTITEALLKTVLSDGARYDILDLSDAIYAGDAKRALFILSALRADGIADTLILWSVVSVLGNIAAIKSKRRPNAWGKNLAGAQALEKSVTPAYLKMLFQQAAYADRVTKGVATGDAALILGGIITRLAARRRGVRISLPYTRE